MGRDVNINKQPTGYDA